MLRALVTSIFLCVNGVAFADECGVLSNRISDAVTETDPRARYAFDQAMAKSGLQKRVILCRLKLARNNAAALRLSDSLEMVVLGGSFAPHFGDLGLLGLLGHEVAHIALGHTRITWSTTFVEQLRVEKSADELSADWFGPRAMQEALLKSFSLLWDKIKDSPYAAGMGPPTKGLLQERLEVLDTRSVRSKFYKAP